MGVASVATSCGNRLRLEVATDSGNLQNSDPVAESNNSPEGRARACTPKHPKTPGLITRTGRELNPKVPPRFHPTSSPPPTGENTLKTEKYSKSVTLHSATRLRPISEFQIPVSEFQQSRNSSIAEFHNLGIPALHTTLSPSSECQSFYTVYSTTIVYYI